MHTESQNRFNQFPQNHFNHQNGGYGNQFNNQNQYNHQNQFNQYNNQNQFSNQNQFNNQNSDYNQNNSNSVYKESDRISKEDYVKDMKKLKFPLSGFPVNPYEFGDNDVHIKVQFFHPPCRNLLLYLLNLG